VRYVGIEPIDGIGFTFHGKDKEPVIIAPHDDHQWVSEMARNSQYHDLERGVLRSICRGDSALIVQLSDHESPNTFEFAATKVAESLLAWPTMLDSAYQQNGRHERQRHTG